MGLRQQTEIVIRPRRGWIPLSLYDFWEYRELLFTLAWRDIKVKYKQSLLGVAWVILRPVMMMAIFSILFGRVAKFPSEGVPYPIFALLGILPWNYFSSAFNESSQSLLANMNLISKIYFPRIMIPLSGGLSNLLDLAVSMIILIFMMFYYKISPQAGLLLVPFLSGVFFISAIGPGVFLSAVNVKYHDVKHVTPFLIQIWMYVTPVIYPVNLIPEKYRLLMYLNPLAGPIEAFRASVLGHAHINLHGLSISVGVSILLCIVGLLYFRRMERFFADVI